MSVRSKREYLSRIQGRYVRAGREHKGRILDELQRLHAQGQLEFHGALQRLSQPATFTRLLCQLKARQPVVYAKRPFAGPQQVLQYLSRYTHRVAISNGRLLCADARNVTFSYKDYAEGARRKTITLAVEEFVRRFCLHLLPERFVKIRHYGLMGNRNRTQRIEQARRLLGVAPTAPIQAPEPEPKSAAQEEPRSRCPHCGADALVWVEEVPRGGRRWRQPVLICDSS